MSRYDTGDQLITAQNSWLLVGRARSLEALLSQGGPQCGSGWSL